MCYYLFTDQLFASALGLGKLEIYLICFPLTNHDLLLNLARPLIVNCLIGWKSVYTQSVYTQTKIELNSEK